MKLTAEVSSRMVSTKNEEGLEAGGLLAEAVGQALKNLVNCRLEKHHRYPVYQSLSRGCVGSIMADCCRTGLDRHIPRAWVWARSWLARSAGAAERLAIEECSLDLARWMTRMLELGAL